MTMISEMNAWKAKAEAAKHKCDEALASRAAYVAKLETVESLLAKAGLERDIAQRNHADSCRLARERLDRINDLEDEIDRLRMKGRHG